MLPWAHERGLTLRLIEPGRPNQNASIESVTAGLSKADCYSRRGGRHLYGPVLPPGTAE
jgi:hypothetical protein